MQNLNRDCKLIEKKRIYKPCTFESRLQKKLRTKWKCKKKSNIKIEQKEKKQIDNNLYLKIERIDCSHDLKHFQRQTLIVPLRPQETK